MTQYDSFAEALLNDAQSYQEYLKDPDYWLFLNKMCFTREELQRYKQAIESLLCLQDSSRSISCFR